MATPDQVAAVRQFAAIYGMAEKGGEDGKFKRVALEMVDSFLEQHNLPPNLEDLLDLFDIEVTLACISRGLITIEELQANKE